MNRNLLKISLLLAVVAIIGFSSCNDDDPIVTPKFSFNKVGNTWTYVMTMTGFPSDTTKIKIGSSLGSGKYEVVSDFGTPDADTMVWLITDTEFALLDGTIKNTLLKIDAKVGDTYTNVNGTDTTVNKVSSIGTSVTVPAGTFNCFQVDEVEGTNVVISYYINKDFGLVKYVIPSFATMQMISKNF